MRATGKGADVQYEGEMGAVDFEAVLYNLYHLISTYFHSSRDQIDKPLSNR